MPYDTGNRPPTMKHGLVAAYADIYNRLPLSLVTNSLAIGALQKVVPDQSVGYDLSSNRCKMAKPVVATLASHQSDTPSKDNPAD